VHAAVLALACVTACLTAGQAAPSAAPAAREAPAGPDVAELDTLCQEALKHWQVPGLSVAIVHQGRAVVVKGFGVKDVTGKAEVASDTRFPLASCTKAFTSLGLAMLVDEQKLDWDDPVRKHLPWFKLADPLADANVTIRDLLCHRTGLGRHDWLWYHTPDSLEDRVRKLALLEPAHSFRSRFEYQPIAFGAAGLALERAAGTSWARFMQERVFTPLDLRASTAVFPTDHADLVASPHRKGPKGVLRIERYPLDIPDPAGSMHASAADLARFLQLHLNSGTWKGRRLVSRESLVELHRPQMLIRREGYAAAINPETRVLSYGLGWVVQDYRGQWLSMHGGVVEGFRAHLTLVPEAGLGIALLNNLDRTMMNLALSNTLVDRFCGLPPRDWHGYFSSVQAEDERLEREHLAEQLAKRKKDTKPSRPLEDYAGDYVNPAYGTCEVRLADGRLTWRWRHLRVPLEHFHFDTFSVRPEPTLYTAIEFEVGPNGVKSLKIFEQTFGRKAP
jgi:CubicO group peptidase (beta-lactamase class C family)